MYAYVTPQVVIQSQISSFIFVVVIREPTKSHTEEPVQSLKTIGESTASVQLYEIFCFYFDADSIYINDNCLQVNILINKASQSYQRFIGKPLPYSTSLRLR